MWWRRILPGQMSTTYICQVCSKPILFSELLLLYILLTLVYILQHSWTLWSLQEGTWLCQAIMEEQKRLKGWRCRHCCFVWLGNLCMDLCWWNCWKGIHFHWLLCLKIVAFKCRFLQSCIGAMSFYTLKYGHSAWQCVILILFTLRKHRWVISG